MSVFILVGDDEPDMEALFRQQFRRDLRAGRFLLEFAASAAEALARAAAAADPSLILILSDINMPGMSGLDLLPKVKTQRPDLPVFMISAYGDGHTMATAMARGANKFVTKPVDFPSLKQDVSAVIERAGEGSKARGAAPGPG